MYEATEKTITLRGRSKIVVKEGDEDVEKEAAAFDAVINSNAPLNMNISAYVTANCSFFLLTLIVLQLSEFWKEGES